MSKKLFLTAFLSLFIGIALADDANLVKEPVPSTATAKKETQRDVNSKKVNAKKEASKKPTKVTQKTLDSQNTKDGK